MIVKGLIISTFFKGLSRKPFNYGIKLICYAHRSKLWLARHKQIQYVASEFLFSIFKVPFKNRSALNNQLTSFPIQPNMEEFFGSDNQLTSFPIQPKMKIFDGSDNQLTSFPIQPNMGFFHGENNQLTSFPIQPKMKEFYGSNNQLTSFPIQPNMEIY